VPNITNEASVTDTYELGLG